MKTLVVFYSRRGIARRIANDYKVNRNADLIDLNVKRNYSGKLGYFKSRSDSLKNYLPEIDDQNIDVTNYDKVIFIGSVWSKSICNPILTFLTKNKGKIDDAEYIVITKTVNTDFTSIFQEMDYVLGTHFKRAVVITVKFNRIINVKRY